MASFERDEAYRKKLDEFRLGRVFSSWMSMSHKKRLSRVKDIHDDVGKPEMDAEDFEETEIPEYEELDRELNGMVDMFRKIFLGGKVFSAIRVISRTNKIAKG